MGTPTVVRVNKTDTEIALVITDLVGLNYFQTYEVFEDGSTVLTTSMPYALETGAIAHWEKHVVTLGNLRKTKIMLQDDGPYDAWTDDTYWNGFLNVYVKPELHEELNRFWEVEYDSELAQIEPSPNGLIYYGGGAVIVDEVET